MKTLCYILSISLLMLSGIPCTDTWSRPAEEACHTGGEGHADGRHEEDACAGEEAETCSPLCPCACIGCHGFSLNIPLSCPLPAPGYRLFSSTNLLVSQYQGYLPAIWQPPQ